MSKLSNSYMLKVITRLLILLAVAKGISLAIWWFSPSDGVELQIEDNYNPPYQRVDFSSMLQSALSTKKSATTSSVTSSGVSINNMILKGLYGEGSQGFAVVALKSSPNKTSIVSVGDNFSGYVLKIILSSSVVFTKNNQEYILEMNEMSVPSSSLITEVVDSAEPTDVSRKDIKFYSDNPKQIWRDIEISEVKNGEKIKGFKVGRINEKSKMYELGLKQGDLILEVNNVKLKSYKDALDVYKEIDKLQTIQIVILRNNTQMELVYEIN